MTSCLAHRGPDAESFYSDSHAALGHRRLSIIDLSSAANQPMRSADGRWVLMFNGEIFNYLELAEELQTSLRTRSDTEVMLELFAMQGLTAVSRLNGMFAIALYEEQKKEMHLFRDRLGVKPLYYYRDGLEWFFASEMKALLAAEKISRRLTLDFEAVGAYLQFGYIPEPLTIWKEIRKFPAGHQLTVSPAGHQWKCYWRATDQLTSSTLRDLGEAKNKLKELLESAVALRMIADVPFGAFLSGGIDSSLVTAIAQRHSPAPVKTFTIGFKEEKFNEAAKAKKIAHYLGTDHEEMEMSYRDALEMCETAMDLFDEPFADSSAIPTLLVSKMARQKVKMILSGDGGDELFMGYGMYRWASRLSHPLYRAVRQPAASVLSLLGNRARRAASLFRFDSGTDLRAHILSQEQYYFSGQETKELLGNHYHPLSPAAATRFPRKLSAAESQALYDLNNHLKDDLLVKVDRSSMKVGLECRTPLLDYRIAAFALNVDESLKRKGGALKMLPRRLLEDYLPKELFDYPKWGFAIPLSSWLKNELSFMIDGYLDERTVKRYHLVNFEIVKKLKQDFGRGRNYLYHRLWNLIVLHRWLEKNY
jgi:asparagine synthase (glutamine-hydrolysing)